MPARYKSAILLFFGIGLLVYLVFFLRYALLILFAGAIVAIMVDPLVEWLSNKSVGSWHISRGAAVGIITAGFAAILALVAWLIIPRIYSQLGAFEREIPQRMTEFTAWINQHLPFLGHWTPQTLKEQALSMVRNEVGGNSYMDVVIGVLAALLAAGYFSADKPDVVRWLISLAPEERQPRLSRTLHRGAERMQKWIAGQALLMLAHGGSALIAFWILHLQFFYLLALFAGLINIIPVVGPVATLVVAGSVAALESVTKLIGVVIFYLVYHNLENVFLNPRIMEAEVRIPAATVIAAIIIGDVMAGVIGMLLSVPTAVLIAALVREYISSRPTRIDQIAAD